MMRSMMIAASLLAGVAGMTLPTAPAAAQPGWHHGDRGHHGRNHHRRRVCRWERHHGHRVQRCAWR